MRAAALLSAAMAFLSAPALAQQAASDGIGATVRMLDRVTGQRADVDLDLGGSARLGQIDVALQACRYPSGNPAGDAVAFLTINDLTRDAEIFSGWMMASAPALNPLDHPRYDVWVIRCKTS